MTDIDRARAIFEAATPGPWRSEHRSGRYGGDLVRFGEPGNGYARMESDNGDENARAIALAHTLAPVLLDVAEACVRPCGPDDAHLRCMLCGVAARVLVHEPGCPVDALNARLREVLGR